MADRRASPIRPETRRAIAMAAVIPTVESSRRRTNTVSGSGYESLLTQIVMKCAASTQEQRSIGHASYKDFLEIPTSGDSIIFASSLLFFPSRFIASRREPTIQIAQIAVEEFPVSKNCITWGSLMLFVCLKHLWHCMFLRPIEHRCVADALMGTCKVGEIVAFYL